MIRIAMAAMMMAAGITLPARAAESGAPALTVELNRMQVEPNGCRLDFVVRNGADFAFQSLQPELAFLGADGVLLSRHILELGPLRPRKTRILSFGLDGLDCSGVGRVILNGLLRCTHGGPKDLDCLNALALRHRGAVPFEK